MSSKINIATAINAVMKEVKGIEKNMHVGTGSYGYKGVSDYEVKKVIGRSMAKHGLSLIPISIDPKVNIERWEEPSSNTNYPPKQKQSVFTEVKTKYLLLHTSGESIEIAGYGHGADTQDKSAGKATTYALKYVLLYTFLTPTGAIDDSDNTHSEETTVPQNKTQTKPVNKKPATQTKKPTTPPKKEDKKVEKKELIEGTKDYTNVLAKIQKGTVVDVKTIQEYYTFSNEMLRTFEEEIKKFKDSKK